MKILALYGRHIEEREWGKNVCEEYVKRYFPAKKEFLAVQLQEVHAMDDDSPEVYQEIANLIIMHAPDTFLDIHHSSGYSNDDQNESSFFFNLLLGN